ncbi:MAG TPA: NACHT domain-containing protein, partial [Micromonosporaceae bacterium]|nr:NACHT domain-containing protein [Micromonosporaceae bacterium]
DFTIQRPGDRLPLLAGDDPGSASAVSSPAARVEDVLASTRRLFVRGQAGLGKTTLLQWIAVQSARQSFPERLADWNDTVPFLVRLRRHAEGQLPAADQFVSEVGRHIAAEMPEGWVQEQLRSGRGVVLVDGVDELNVRRRGEVRRWLRELGMAFPRARFVVTSRPAAAPADWLDGEAFDVAELEPMDRHDVRTFVSRWHAAMREQCDRPEELNRLSQYQRRLTSSLETQRHLHALAGYPLLCALLCALHLDRHGQLPRNRMELYDVALQMLLERRDQERRIHAGPALSRTETTLLLRDIAYWLIDNGWSSAPAARVRGRIAAKLTGMPQIAAGAEEVYQALLERSGLIREPAEGQTDFVHRTFQEYLAAQEAVASDNIGALIRNAYTDLWSDVVVLAAGHATASQRTELLSGLLRRARELSRKGSRRLSDSLRLVAVACLETSPELSPELREEVRDAARSLLPPKTMAAARTLSRTGTFTVDLLARTEPKSAAEVAATIRAASETEDPAALALLARFGKDSRKSVV